MPKGTIRRTVKLLLATCIVSLLLTGCSKALAVYNEKRDSDFKKVKSVNGLIFEVPEEYLEEATSVKDLASIEDVKKDKSYYMDTLSDVYMLFNFEEYIIFASSNVEDIDLEEVEDLDDLQDMLDDSDSDDFKIGKKYVRSTNKDGVIKMIVDASADLEFIEGVDNEFHGKIVLIQDDDIASMLFVGVTEDEAGKKANKMIDYVAKSVVADEYDPSLEDKFDTGAEDDIEVSETPAEEEQPEPTTAPSVAPETDQTSTGSGTLSNDLYSFQIEIEGEVYQLPMKYSDFVSRGWISEEDDTQTLAPNEYMMGCTFTKGDMEISAEIINMGVNVEPYSNCLIGGLCVEEYYDAPTISASLPGGITYGVSSKEDIIAAYGDPTDLYESEYSISLTYEYASYQEIEIGINPETKVVDSIDVRNFVLPEGALQNVEINTEVPDIVKQYKAPSSLGDDFTKFIVEFDGALYQLPAPYSEFEKNGWKIVESESDANVVAKDSGWITLIKNNQSFRAMVYNYADYATTVENCFVTEVEADVNYMNVPLTVQKGITIGMSKKDLEKALSGTTFETYDGSSYISYSIAGPDSILDCVEILINKETNKVYKIEVSNRPASDKLFKQKNAYNNIICITPLYNGQELC